MKKIISELLRNRLLSIIIFLSFLFFIAIAFDITPLLRGPAPYPPDWRWDYLFVNTLPRVIPALTIIAAILFLFYRSETKPNFSKKHHILFLLLLVFLHVMLQFAVLYFSRSGIPVLIHRITNPDLNGYFTTATRITDVGVFLSTYTQFVLQFSMHAQGHPPGAVLFFYGINKIAALFPVLNGWVAQFTPVHEDVRAVWQLLKPNEKLGVFLSIILIPFLSSLTIIPFYAATKLLTDEKIARRSLFLYLFIPGIILFVPINDVFLPLFTATSLLYFIHAIKKRNMPDFFLSGTILSLGLFFSFSLLPLLLFFGSLFIFMYYKCLFKTKTIISGVWFFFGLFVIPLMLFLGYGINYFSLIQTIMSGLPENRHYFPWVFYNLYDFFVFAGIPVLILYLAELKQSSSHIVNKRFKKLSLVFIAFSVMLLVLNFSGAVRGEVGRIWIPFIPILILITAQFATKKLKFTRNEFLVILLLQAVQILVMQEFWVTLW